MENNEKLGIAGMIRHINDSIIELESDREELPAPALQEALDALCCAHRMLQNLAGAYLNDILTSR